MNQYYKDRKKQADKNRRDMPNVAEIVDLITKLYGPAKVIGAEDYVTKKKIGKLDDE